MGSRLTKLAWLAGAGAVIVGAAFGLFIAALPGPPLRSPPPTDAIIVLTGSEKRVQEGMRLLAEGRGRRLLISGVHRSTTKDDLRRMIGLAPIFFDCCVDLGHEALSTTGNAEEAEAWVKAWRFQSVLVVTAHYHMPRSMTELKRVLPNTTLIAHPVFGKSYQNGVWWADAAQVRILVVEFLKTMPAAGRLVLSRLFGSGDSRAVHNGPRSNPVSVFSKL